MPIVHTSLGKRIGAEGSYSRGGMFTLKEQHLLDQGREWYPDTNIVLSGLQLRLDAANPNSYPGSGNTWFDLSGNGFNATLINGPTWTPAQSGYFNVNASSPQTFSVSKPNPNISGQITTEIWVYLDSFPSSGNGSFATFMHKGGHYTTQFSNQGQSYYFADSSTYSYATYGTRSIQGLAAGAWRQIVTTKDTSNTVRLYINGSIVDTRTSFGSPLPLRDTTLWLIGYGDGDVTPTDLNTTINGRISVAHVYNRQLSDAEVLQNFNAIKGRYGL